MNKLDTLFCLSGCTAVGKTRWALDWAESNGAEIVNCDSLLFYRGMDIGTAKPNAAELHRVKHHLIDIAQPDEQMDVGRFVESAIDAIREIQGRGKKALVTGGSGFYLKAFFEPVVDAVQVSPTSRAEAEALLEEGLPVAVEALRQRNPQGLGGLDVHNPRRVLRALERCIESGQSLEELKTAFAAQANALTEAPKRLTVLERDRQELVERIERRVDQMLAEGLVQEVERLLESGIERNPSAARAIGYRETISYLRGDYDLETLRQSISVNTRRLAKKQRTWFRGQLPRSARVLGLAGDREVRLEELFD